MAYCAVSTCNNNQRKNKNVRFYRFPKDSELCEKWVDFCGKEKGLINTANARICSTHFSDEFDHKLLKHKLLLYSPKNRRRITATAIPTLHGPINIQPVGNKLSPDVRGSTIENSSAKETKTCRRNLFSIPKEDSRRKIEEDVKIIEPDGDNSCRNNRCPWKLKYESDLKTWNAIFKKRDQSWKTKIKTIHAQRVTLLQENERLKSELKQTNEEREIGKATQNLFTPGQLRKLITKKNIKWTAEDIASAISLRSISPKAYRYLRNKCNYPFPAFSTLRRWASTFKIYPGLLENVFLLMKNKAKDLSILEKLTVLTFDEMFIKGQYCFDKRMQQVYGPHRTVQVIMARGLCSNWKQPIYYQFDQAVTKDILESAIQSLHDSGYIVVAMVSDMGSNNMKLWSELGITTTSNSFEHPCDDNKRIFVFADIPHLLKLLRNHFLDDGFELFDSIISKNCVEQFLAISQSELKIGHKITKYLLDVKGPQRQKVKTAAKLLSHTTAKIIRYCGENKLIDEPNYEIIADFIDLIDKWFDIFNTSEKYSQKVNAYGVDLDEQNKIINKVTSIMEELRSLDRRSLLPFQKGIIVSNKSLQGLHTYLKETYNIEYILTRRLNQDILENFFSYIRAMGGSNDNPDPIDFMSRLKWYILGKHTPTDLSDNKNCEEDDVTNLAEPLQDNDICLTVPLFLSIIDNQPISHIDQDEAEVAHLQFNDEGCDVNVTLPSTKINDEGLKYLAGYVAHRFRTKYPTLGSATSKKSDNSSISKSGWIEFISEGGLLIPSPKLLYVARVMETMFLAFHGSEIKKIPNIVQIVVNMVSEKIGDHDKVPKEVLECLVRTRTYIRIRELNKSLTVTGTKTKHLKKMKKILGQ